MRMVEKLKGVDPESIPDQVCNTLIKHDLLDLSASEALVLLRLKHDFMLTLFHEKNHRRGILDKIVQSLWEFGIYPVYSWLKSSKHWNFFSRFSNH